MYQVHDVDDTTAFLAAARSLRLGRSKYTSASSSTGNADTEAGTNVDADADAFGDSTAHGKIATDTSFDAKDSDDVAAIGAVNQKDDGFGEWDVEKRKSSTDEPLEVQVQAANPVAAEYAAVDPVATESVSGQVAVAVTSKDTLTLGTASSVVSAETAVAAGEENRERLLTFKSWGTPEVRDKPAARVRRIILKGIPSTFNNAKILRFIHGGAIESISVIHGDTHVLFCEPEACQAFYDKYRNGIFLDKDRRNVVFVEKGQNVDIVGSQLSFNLSVGATRVVRAVGVDMNITMGQLLKLAILNNRKVEKILDHYIPGEARNVTFRFCSIDDAVCFRSLIIRDADWEHCNIQYAKDPCEATGFHAD